MYGSGELSEDEKKELEMGKRWVIISGVIIFVIIILIYLF